MSNTYTPPTPLDFYSSGAISSGLIYYNAQNSTTNAYTTSLATFSTMTCYTANSITIPAPGDYLITVHTGAYCGSALTNRRILFQFLFTKSGQTNITVQDVLMHVMAPASFIAYSNSFTRKVTFPVAGVWVLTPQWASDAAGVVSRVDASAYYQWVVAVVGLQPPNSINNQLTKFLDSSYTLMTNVDANAYWGSLTTTTVSGYSTTLDSHTSSLASHTSTLGSHTSSINALSESVSNLSVNVASLEATISGLTSVAATSGGIRIKP